MRHLGSLTLQEKTLWITGVVKQVGKQVKQAPCLSCTSRKCLAARMPCQAR